MVYGIIYSIFKKGDKIFIKYVINRLVITYLKDIGIMNNNQIEKKIYKILGVNIFRRYVLGTYEKIFNFIPNLLGYKGYTGYRINDFSTLGLQKFKSKSIGLAIQHVIQFSVVALAYISVAITVGLTPYMLSVWIICSLLEIYSFMSNRQHCIRIDEILEKRKKIQELLEQNNTFKNAINNDSIMQRQESLPLSHERISSFKEFDSYIEEKNRKYLENIINQPKLKLNKKINQDKPLIMEKRTK